MKPFQMITRTAPTRIVAAGPAILFAAIVIDACGSNALPGPSPFSSPESEVRLTGRVHQAGSPSIPVLGAQVEVVGGPAAGLTTTTDWFGSYALADVPGNAEIRVTKDGYAPSVMNLREHGQVTPQFGRLDIALVWAGAPPPDMSGSYTLTVSADCPATSDLQAPLRTRQYSASVSRRNESEVEVRLSGAEFEIEQGSGKGDRFVGRIAAEGILFDLEAVWDWGPHPSVLERLTDGWLEISGTALARYSGTGLSGMLKGSFTYYPGSNPSWYVFRTCGSDSHRFVLSR